jgi:ABC-2 type transport system permease protein
LAGNLPAGMRHLQNSVKELLDEFNAYNTKITYDFIDIHNLDNKTKDSLVGDLVSLGAQPVDLNVKQKDGVKSRQMIFPVAIIAQDNNIDLIELMQSQAGNSQEDIINTSIENLEYQFVSAIYRMSLTEHKKIAFLEGHGELSPQESLDAAYALSAFYDVYRVNLKSDAFSILDTINSQIVPFFETIIIAQPKTTFSDLEKWAIDQHIMHGGKVLWFIDDNNASLDTLREMQQQPAISYPTQLGDLLFKYGVRVNNDLVLDLNSNSIPLIVGYSGNQPQTEFFPFFYLPIIVSDNNHILNKNLNPIKTEFISSIDTISNDIKKTAILTTSPYSRKMKTPCIIDFSMLGENLNPLDFSAGKQVVAILLEGNFESAFKRILPNEVRNKSFQSKIISDSNKMIVVADGDIIKNNYNFVQNYPLPLGFDNYTKQSFDNKTFVVNCVNYLCDGDFLLNLRNKTLKIRLLDKQRLLIEERKWQIINLVAPVAMIFVFALIFLLTRKYKNKKFKQQLL